MDIYNNKELKTRECPYCHQIISLKRCIKYWFRGTNYSTTCNHCNNRVKLEKEPFPFMYSVFAGLLSIYLPMNYFLYFSKMPFLKSLLYSLPFVIGCLVVIAVLIPRRLFFKRDS